MVSWDGLNRRKFPRVLYPCMVIVRAKEDHQEAILAHTENVGNGGLCLIMRRELKMFTAVDVELDLLDMGDHIRCQGKVVWSIRRKSADPTKPMAYDVGVEFVNLAEKDRQRIDQVIQRLAKYARV
jgi:hypothetical protein